MSGATLAVGPDPGRVSGADTAATDSPPQKAAASVMGSLRIIELQLVAFIMVFSASGMVPLIDIVYPVFTTLYIIGLAQFAFPSRRSGPGSSSAPEIFKGSRMFRFYVVLGTTFGLFLPLAYVLGGFARGDDHAVRSATPHLFLLSCQILTENIISGLSLFSPPVRALVPLLYTARRLVVITNWIDDVWINKALPANADIRDVAWFWFGRALALANFAYFSVNMTCFLIPRFLPRAFERYYINTKDEGHYKMEEDDRSAAINQAAETEDDKKDI